VADRERWINRFSKAPASLAAALILAPSLTPGGGDDGASVD
jgi:hypothetical protein